MTPELANEALADPERLTLDPDPSSESGRTLRVIGYAASVDAIVTVIVLPDGDVLWGVNAWPANPTDQRKYQGGQELMDIGERIRREAEASEQNPDAPERPGTTRTRGTPRGRTLQVRLTAEEFEQIQRLAEQAGIPASALARQILLSAGRPAAERSAVLKRIQHDLELLAH